MITEDTTRCSINGIYLLEQRVYRIRFLENLHHINKYHKNQTFGITPKTMKNIESMR